MSTLLDDLTVAREKIRSPELWTKGALARNASGEYVGVRCSDAVCWCLLGAVAFATDWPDRVWPRWHEAIRSIASEAGLAEGSPLSGWNDAQERTHAEILAALDRAINRRKSS